MKLLTLVLSALSCYVLVQGQTQEPLEHTLVEGQTQQPLENILVDEEPPSCEAMARTADQPVDGWRRVTNSVTGEETCYRLTISLPCLGDQYYHPQTRDPECCDAPNDVLWVDEQAKLGYCAGPGEWWSGDLVTGYGGLCPIGLHMISGECIDLGDLNLDLPELF